LGIVLVLGTVLSIAFDFMILYMGIFFIVFSLFKIIDWKGFVEAFSRYDLIGMNFRSYSWIYPAIEFFIGIGFLLHQFYSGYFLTSLAWVTLFIMGAGGIGVGVKLLKKEKFQCACLGTRINLPLTKVTLLEDVLMAGMSLIVIF
jgi:hypothetical protein